jgi:ankyrin repeat protein
VETLLQHPEARINARDRRGWTPLFWAAGNGENEIISLLVQYGADVNIRDRDGVTSLHWAAWKGQFSSVETLLDFGADANALDKIGMSAGDWASEAKRPDIARLFDVSICGEVTCKLWLECDNFMPGV